MNWVNCERLGLKVPVEVNSQFNSSRNIIALHQFFNLYLQSNVLLFVNFIERFSSRYHN